MLLGMYAVERAAPWLLGLLALGCSSRVTVNGQLSDAGLQAAAVKACTAADTLHAATIAEFVGQMSHAWSYGALSLNDLNALSAAARALETGDVAAATDAAMGADYEIVPLSAASACYWVMRPTAAAPAGQATLIYAAHWERDLVIEAPHAYEDRHTDLEAAQIFTDVAAKALVISGAHRCAVTSSSGCHASTECDKVNHVPAQSDPSHSINNGVNALHLAFRTSETVILQLHTNLCPDLNGDALVSNGTHYSIPGTPAEALSTVLKAADVDIRSCNDPLQPLPTGLKCAATGATTPFCGETSTQSLASNGAADACLGRSSSAGGAALHRFIHLEQSNWRMCLTPTENAQCVDTVDAWANRIATALSLAIPPAL
jgi:hypothetical protein